MSDEEYSEHDFDTQTPQTKPSVHFGNPRSPKTTSKRSSGLDSGAGTSAESSPTGEQGTTEETTPSPLRPSQRDKETDEDSETPKKKSWGKRIKESPSKFMHWVTKRRQKSSKEKPEFPPNIYKQKKPPEQDRNLYKLLLIKTRYTRWEREVPQSQWNVGIQREIHRRYLKFRDARNDLCDKIAENINHLYKLAQELKYVEELAESTYSHRMHPNKRELLDEMKEAWKHMAAYIYQTCENLDRQVQNFVDCENQREKLFSINQLMGFLIRMDGLAKYVEEDRKTLNVMQQNAYALLEHIPQSKIEAPKFILKSIFPRPRIRDQRNVRSRLKGMRKEIEEKVIAVEGRAGEDEPGTIYDAHYFHPIVVGTKKRSGRPDIV